MLAAAAAASSGLAALAMPPIPARPVTQACILTITGAFSSSAMARASSGVAAARPRGTGILCWASSAFP